jgi:hypothetical protein
MFFLLLFDPTIPISQTLEMIARFWAKETKITARGQPGFAKNSKINCFPPRGLGRKNPVEGNKKCANQQMDLGISLFPQANNEI